MVSLWHPKRVWALEVKLDSEAQRKGLEGLRGQQNVGNIWEPWQFPFSWGIMGSILLMGFCCDRFFSDKAADTWALPTWTAVAQLLADFCSPAQHGHFLAFPRFVSFCKNLWAFDSNYPKLEDKMNIWKTTSHFRVDPVFVNPGSPGYDLSAVFFDRRWWPMAWFEMQEYLVGTPRTAT